MLLSSPSGGVNPATCFRDLLHLTGSDPSQSLSSSMMCFARVGGWTATFTIAGCTVFGTIARASENNFKSQMMRSVGTVPGASHCQDTSSEGF